jgi:hypothetical protein
MEGSNFVRNLIHCRGCICVPARIRGLTGGLFLVRFMSRVEKIFHPVLQLKGLRDWWSASDRDPAAAIRQHRTSSNYVST